MRITVSIDDDVLLVVRERARQELRTVDEVLSDLARQALKSQLDARVGAGLERHGFRPMPHRRAAVTNALIDRLREDEPE